jgi:hypothetical protein
MSTHTVLGNQMIWYDAKRTSGKPNEAGAFIVSNHDGLHWQVSVMAHPDDSQRLLIKTPFQCVNRPESSNPGDWIAAGIQAAIHQRLSKENTRG